MRETKTHYIFDLEKPRFGVDDMDWLLTDDFNYSEILRLAQIKYQTPAPRFLVPRGKSKSEFCKELWKEMNSNEYA